MPRKQIKHPENYLKPFPSRLRILMSESSVTQQTLAECIGVSRQSVSCYCDGSTYPDWETIVNIADYFQVSTDWLLGRSEVRSIDLNIKKVCEFIGLSENAVLILNTCKDLDMLGPIEYIINDPPFLDLLNELSSMKEEWEEYIKDKQEISDEESHKIENMKRELFRYGSVVLSLGESIVHRISVTWEYRIKDIMFDYIFGRPTNEVEALARWLALD